MEAGTFHCPSCGASISGDSTQCKYCKSQLQTVACASCFGMMFLGSKFCPHCGAAAAEVDRGPAVAHPCPRCVTQHLQTVNVAGVALEECGGCGGLWVSVDVFNKICADRVTQEAAIGVALPSMVTTNPQQHAARYLKCPQCNVLMNRWNFADRSGVVLDKCRQHGLWFDRDELRRVIEFVRAGGLTLAREREIDELKRQREALQADRSTADTGTSSMAGIRGFSSYGGYSNGPGLIEGIAEVLWSFLK